MKNLIIPNGYKAVLDIWQTEHAIKFIKDSFQKNLASSLKLRRVTAPLMVQEGTGLNDNLSGAESPVRFPVNSLNGANVEIVQSLAKWKRYSLWRQEIKMGVGIYTDMNAIRPCEETDNIHSLYVDQWDWEKVISLENRTVEVLYDCVRDIYSALCGVQFLLTERYPKLEAFLAEDIFFIHAQELLDVYPDSTPKEREAKITEKHGAVFIRGIGGILTNGEAHDGRSPDYDDWSTKTPEGYEGLNGDILVWNPVLKAPLELSSMGIRVSPETLENQLNISDSNDRRELMFHKLLLEGKFPQTMGGGIGQSRLCMLLLQKCHIGEVHAAVWSEEVRDECEKKGVFLF